MGCHNALFLAPDLFIPGSGAELFMAFVSFLGLY